MLVRRLSDKERVEFLRKLSETHIPGLDMSARAILGYLATARSLWLVEGKVFVSGISVTMICGAMRRRTSAISCHLKGLREAGFIERLFVIDHGNGFDLSGLAAEIGFAPSISIEDDAQDTRKNETGIRVPGSRTRLIESPVLPLAACDRSSMLSEIPSDNISGNLEIAGNPDANNSRKSGETALYSKSHSKIYNNNYNYQDSMGEGKTGNPEIGASASEISAFEELIRKIPSVVADLPHGNEILALLTDLPSDLEAGARDLPAILARHFPRCAAGAGISVASLSQGMVRFGATGLVIQSVYALLTGRAPKGLLISILKGQVRFERSLGYALDTIERLVEAGMKALRVLEADAQRKETERREGLARERAENSVKRIIDRLSHVDLSDFEPEIREQIRRGPGSGYAQIKTDQSGKDRLIMAFPQNREFNLWQSVSDRVLSGLNDDDIPTVVVLSGALAGSGRIHLADLCMGN